MLDMLLLYSNVDIQQWNSAISVLLRLACGERQWWTEYIAVKSLVIDQGYTL